MTEEFSPRQPDHGEVVRSISAPVHTNNSLLPANPIFAFHPLYVTNPLPIPGHADEYASEDDADSSGSADVFLRERLEAYLNLDSFSGSPALTNSPPSMRRLRRNSGTTLFLK